MASISAWIVEYSCVDAFPLSGVLYGQHNRGTRPMPHCFGVVEVDRSLILVDAGIGTTAYGLQMCRDHGIARFQPIDVMLGRLGWGIEDVDAVLLTHAHFDHAGGLKDLGEVRTLIQRRELEFATSLTALPARLGWLRTAYDPETAPTLLQLERSGLLDVVDGEHEPFAGVRLLPCFDTHTAGSQAVLLDTDDDGPFVLAGDVMYVWENIEGLGDDGAFVPVGLASGSQEADLRAMGDLLDRVGGETTRVVPVHDAALWSRFPSHRWDDGLHVAEITLASSSESRLPS